MQQNQPNITAVLVSQTHWDRAWYLPYQTFRLRLVRLIDGLLKVLAENPDFRSFMLDGQMLPLDDYLEIRPEQREKLKEFVRAGRLFIGPWYVLADEYLVSPEALIRNLMTGLRMAEALGGATRIGYAPDGFGHISQLPQILRGFGIESAILWRGLGDEGEELGDEFLWQAPNGSQVLTIHLRNGYFNAANLGYPNIWGDTSALTFDMDLAMVRLRQAVDRLKPYNKSGTFLLMNGIDHAEIEPNLPVIIAQANRQFTEVNFVQGNLPEYIDEVRLALANSLPVFQGELNRSRYGAGLQGVYSSRMYLQQANEAAQTLLECYSEPISAWAWLLGQPYPKSFLNLTWRTLLQNHPHDDICGCSTDEVHREDMTRFDNVKQICAPLARDGFRFLMKCIDRSAQSGVPFVIYNPTASARTETSQLELSFDPEDSTAGNFHLVDADGKAVASQIVSRESVMALEVGKTHLLQRVKLSAVLENIPACGYKVLYAQPGPHPETQQLENPVQVFINGMENAYLRLEIATDGSLILLDKHTGQHFEKLLYFCDDEDIGDEYDYSPAPLSQQITTLGQPASARLLEDGPLQASYQINHHLALPVSITPDRRQRSKKRVNCLVTTKVTLRYNSPIVDLTTTLDNRACDHRLRVCFSTGLQTDVATADGHYDVLTRPIDFPKRPDWDQPPVPTRHQRYFIDLSDGKAGIAIFNRGLVEYEILPQDGGNTVALTLLRCVGHLSCGDLPTRSFGNAGPANIATPDAQCLGMHTFEYAIAPHADDWQKIYANAYAFRAPFYVRCGLETEGFLPTAEERRNWGSSQLKNPDRSGDLPSEGSFLSLQPALLTLSAVKRAEDDNRLVLRFYNPSPTEVDAAIQLYWPIRSAVETDLNEKPGSALRVGSDNIVRLSVAGKEVKTIAFEFKQSGVGEAGGQ